MPKDVRLIFGNTDQADQATVAKKKDVGKEVKGRKWPSAVLEKIMVVHSQHGDAGHQEVFSLRKVALTTGTPGQQVERRDRSQDAEIPKGPGICLFPICPEGGIKILMLHLMCLHQIQAQVQQLGRRLLGRELRIPKVKNSVVAEPPSAVGQLRAGVPKLAKRRYRIQTRQYHSPPLLLLVVFHR